MSRYIDADALITDLNKGLWGKDWDKVLAEAIINEAPSIDIVRCKDCKWAEPNREGDYDCKCHMPIFRVIADDYCSYGERREP